MVNEPIPDESAPHTAATRARMAVAVAARELSDFAATFVPIPPGDLSTTGGRNSSDFTGGGSVCAELDDGRRLGIFAEHLLEKLVVFQKVAGASWKDVGDGLGVARQNAHSKYGDAVDLFTRALAGAEYTEPGVDGKTYIPPLPVGADEPEVRAKELDRWYCQVAGVHASDTPVSAGLARMHPQMELARLTAERGELLQQFLVPPTEDLLRIAERQVVLWEQIAAADPAFTVTATKAAQEIRASIEQLRAQQAQGSEAELQHSPSPEAQV